MTRLIIAALLLAVGPLSWTPAKAQASCYTFGGNNYAMTNCSDGSSAMSFGNRYNYNTTINPAPSYNYGYGYQQPRSYNCQTLGNSTYSSTNCY
jgi:hypothetical protein